MATSPVSGSDPIGGAASISQNEFLKLMVTQLQYQDPFKPLDQKDFLVQMAQFSSLAQTQQISDHVSSLLNFSSSSQAVGLLGKSINFENEDGDIVAGTVLSIDFNTAEPLLSVQTSGVSSLINMAKIRLVKNPSST